MTLSQKVNNIDTQMNMRSTLYTLPFSRTTEFLHFWQTIGVLLNNIIDQVISLNSVHKLIDMALVWHYYSYEFSIRIKPIYV